MARIRRSAAWWRAYREYLGSPEWAELRKEALDRDGHMCQDCGQRKATQVHHDSYDNVGDEDPDDLLSLCAACHRKRHPERNHAPEEEEVMP